MRKARFIFLTILAILGCTRERIFEETRFLMGTVVDVKVVHQDPEIANRAIEAAFKEMERINGLMDFYDEGSEVWRINHAKGGVRIGEEMMEVIKTSIEYSKMSGGAFDITIGPLMRLWNFGAKSPSPPSLDEVRERLECVGYEKIMLDENRGIIHLLVDGMMIDLGGVAKGYAVMRACRVLKDMGISSALINAGGDIQVIGEGPRGPWRIGIQHPRREGIVKILLLSDEAVATSGDYERYFIHDGVRYHHIIDPRTGYPARGCISVSIVSENAFLCDILATAVFVLGKEEGLTLIEGIDGVEAIVVTKEGISSTSGVGERLLTTPWNK